MWERGQADEIWELREFQQRRAEGKGVIVIHDRVRDAPIAHSPACPFVKEDSFRQKIVEMGGKNGRYYWYERFADAERALGARPCGRCG